MSLYVCRCEGQPVGERRLHSWQSGGNGVHHPADGLLPGVADVRDEGGRDHQQHLTRRLWPGWTAGYCHFDTTGQVGATKIWFPW